MCWGRKQGRHGASAVSAGENAVRAADGQAGETQVINDIQKEADSLNGPPPFAVVYIRD